jgi:hypothetical protein
VQCKTTAAVFLTLRWYLSDTISDALLGLPTTAVVRTYGTTATAYEAPWN